MGEVVIFTPPDGVADSGGWIQDNEFARKYLLHNKIFRHLFADDVFIKRCVGKAQQEYT